MVYNQAIHSDPNHGGSTWSVRYAGSLAAWFGPVLAAVWNSPSVLSAQNEQLEARYLLKSQGYDFGYALARVAKLSGLEADHILRAGKQPARLYARSLLCHWAIRSLGMTAVAVSKLLGISPSVVTRAAYRGEVIAAANGLELVDKINA